MKSRKLRIALLSFIGLLVLLALVSLVLPPTWEVERTIQVATAPADVYPFVADFKNGWTRWSPFGPRMDPNVKVTFAGNESGVGAIENFTGGQLGEGTMRITKADPEHGITYELDGGPVHIVGVIQLTANAQGTAVTWADSGSFGSNPLMRYMALIAGAASGGTMEKGLADLRQLAEAHHRGIQENSAR